MIRTKNIKLFLSVVLSLGFFSLSCQSKKNVNLVASESSSTTPPAESTLPGAPTGTLAINASATHTNLVNVLLSISSSSATEMYISAISGCASGGNWEAFNASKSYTLPNANATNHVYLKLRDSQGLESQCLSASIAHDNVAPAVSITTPSEGAVISSGNQSSYTVSGTCSENGRSVTVGLGGITSSPTCANNAFTTNLNLGALNNGAHQISASQVDQASNNGVATAINVTKSILSVTAIISGEPTSPSNQTSLNVTISGADIAQYRFKIIPTGSLCSDSAGYSGLTSVATLITSSFSGLPDGPTTLCVIGQDAGGSNIQAFGDASSVTWTKDTTGPTAPSGLALGAITSNMGTTPTIDWSSNATDVTTSVASYQIQVRRSADASIHQDWIAVTKGASLTLPATNPMIINDSYTIRVRGVDAAGNFGEASSDSAAYTINGITITAFTGSAPDIANASSFSAGGGYLYAYGGINDAYNTWLNVNHFISPSNSWSVPTGVPALLAAPNRRLEAGTVWVANRSQFFIFGGWSEGWWPRRTDVHTYNPATNTWATGTDLETDLPGLKDPNDANENLEPTRTQLFSDGDRVYLWGGRIRGSSGSYGYSNFLLRYDFATTPKWQQMATPATQLTSYYAHAAFGAGKLIAINAQQDGSFNFTPAGAIYDVATNSWLSLTFGVGSAPSVALVNYSLVIDSQRNRAYLFGGHEAYCDTPALSCEPTAQDITKYNPHLYSINLDTGAWTILNPTGNPPPRLIAFGSTWANNIMITFGGMTDHPSYEAFNTIYAYYPEKNRWVTIATPSEGVLSKRFGLGESAHASAGLVSFDQNNKVMIYGGFSVDGSYNTVQTNTGASILIPF